MTSLFTRSRTKSTTHKNISFNTDGNGAGDIDELGRVSSRGARLGTPKKKDKKKKNVPPVVEEDLVTETPFPDGAFLPLNLERPKTNGANAITMVSPVKQHDYGHLSSERHVVLGLDQLERLVEVVSEELETRGGITTPFIFSNTALDISSSAIKRLIRTFLNTCDTHNEFRAQEAEMKWREEARFAGPHELGMCLRWGLARVIRSVGGQDVRGLLSYEHYLEFRETEAGRHLYITFFLSKGGTGMADLASTLLLSCRGCFICFLLRTGLYSILSFQGLGTLQPISQPNFYHH